MSVGFAAHELLFDLVLELLQESLFLVAGWLAAVGEEAALAVHGCWGGGEGEEWRVILGV